MAICRFQYAVKVLCGEVRERGGPLAPGLYTTEINVHNPSDHPVFLRKRLALTMPPGGQKEGEVVLVEEHPLAPERALAVDCRYLGERIGVGPFFIGFLVIESTDSLDVVAVYTTSGFREGTAPSIAVEQVKERRTTRTE